MAHPLSPEEQLEKCSAELAVLDGVIDYADKMIRQEGLRSPYAALRRHAYGKTVVIESEKKGRMIFRLSSTPALYPDFASGYATPHSPVGRLCSFLRPGDEDETPAWGSYRVVESRLFDRFDGLSFEDNVRNFLRMSVNGEDGHGQVADLRRTVLKGTRAVNPPSESESTPVESMEAVASPGQAAPIVVPIVHKGLELAHLEIADDDVHVPHASEYEDVEDDIERSESSTDGYFGLSETFYVNRTREQDEIIARSPVGAMFVEGVAGSGKTSAALGRAKMLCDFTENSVTEERDFRDIVGHALTHWSGKFAGKFSQEGSIGFVRTGELTQYLKETCRRIELPHLPVAEFKQLQVRLREHRKIERSRTHGGRWTMTASPRGTETDTTMDWLFAADRAIAAHIADQMVDSLPERSAITELFVPEQRQRVDRIVGVAMQAVHEAIKPVQTALRGKPSNGRFALDRLANTFASIIQDVRSKVLGKDVLWLLNGEQTLYASNEHALASLLVRRKVPLFLRTPARLVALDEGGPVDDTLTFYSLDGQQLDWDDQTRELLAAGRVAARDASGNAFPAVSADVNSIAMRLFPEALDHLYVLREGKLHQLTVQRGLGRLKFELLEPQPEVTDDDTDGSDHDDLAAAATVTTRFKTVEAALRQSLKRALLQRLTYLADAYMEALSTNGEYFPERALAQRIHAQLRDRQLSDEDIDLLLCLSHLVGRGFDGSPATLRPPAYYQCVFIDEVQDFTEQQIYLMAEQAKPDYKAVTAVGDIAQKLHHGSQIDIAKCFPGTTIAHVKLSENLRQLDAPGLAWFSTCFRTIFQDDLAGSRPTGELRNRLLESRADIQGPELALYDDLGGLDAEIIKALRKVPAHQTATIILPDAHMATQIHKRLRSALAEFFIETELSEKIDLSRRHVRYFTSVAHAKGLEFDVVLMPHLESYDLQDRSHVNRLYVGLTRARKRLVLLSARGRESSEFDAVWRKYEDGIARL